MAAIEVGSSPSLCSVPLCKRVCCPCCGSVASIALIAYRLLCLSPAHSNRTSSARERARCPCCACCCSTAPCTAASPSATLTTCGAYACPLYGLLAGLCFVWLDGYLCCVATTSKRHFDNLRCAWGLGLACFWRTAAGGRAGGLGLSCLSLCRLVHLSKALASLPHPQCGAPTSHLYVLQAGHLEHLRPPTPAHADLPG